MRALVIAVKLLLLVVLAFAFFVAYTFTLPTVQGWLPTGGSRAWFAVAKLVEAVVLAGVWVATFAMPVAMVYGAQAPAAAAVMVLPTVYTYVSVLLSVPRSWAVVLLTLAAPLCLLIVVPLLTDLAHRAWRKLCTRRDGQLRGAR